MRIESGSKLIMIGDSVTDCGRARPVGEGRSEAIGNGYVSLVQSSIMTAYPERRIRVINMGVSGNTVRDLKERWESDVIALKPDWLSIMIGINDVWRQFDLPLQKELHIYIDEYKETLEELVDKTKSKLKGLVLMTPYYIEPNKNDAMRAMMDKYGAAVKKLAEKHGTLFADTQASFDRILKFYHPNMICWDRVHPNNVGHMVLAQVFLNAIEI
ncbi:MAG: SGNH/GDSL hydrolase family protein [Clostridiaceae bacterium]|nr:SGNH/GDSL hydrolase family protein [Clostridiaceae bacterium]